MKNATHFIIATTAIITILVIGKSILIPFMFALIFWFISREIRNIIYLIPFTKKYLPIWLSNILVFSLIILVFIFITQILSNSVKEVIDSYGKYESNVTQIIKELNQYFQTDIVQYAGDELKNFNYGATLRSFANGISGVLGDTFMIVIYALFLFLEESSFGKKIGKVFLYKKSDNDYQSLFGKIENSISKYLRLKTLVSILTGFLSYIVLLIMDIDGALFWAFLIFLLNFIPTVGSLVGTLFPAIFSLFQFGEFTPFFIILIAVGLIQVLVGNLLEPKVFGKSLNVSPLITILGLAIWGKIWGLTGMFLSVPITVIMIIVFSQFENTRAIAVFLSENGEIDNQE